MDILDKINGHLNEENDNGYSCPPALADNRINVENHLKSIKEVALGPVDPRQPNEEFWKDKAEKWKITEGDARAKLCLNCVHYVLTRNILDCIANGPAKFFKVSDLPVSPKLVDIESKPTAYCTIRHITCSPLRTCDLQEMGGPIDDMKADAIKLHKTTAKDMGEDIGEIEDYL